MQSTLLILIALGGLGTQNPPVEPPPPIAPIEAQPVATTPASIPMYDHARPLIPLCNSAVCSGYVPPRSESFRKCLGDTICSFILGRDPDVPSAREIEAAYCSGGYVR